MISIVGAATSCQRQANVASTSSQRRFCSCRGSVSKAMKYGITWGLSQSMIFFAFSAAFGYGTYLVAINDMYFEDVFR